MQSIRPERHMGHRARIAGAVAAIALALPIIAAAPSSAATLDKIKESGTINLGYRADARPFSFRDDAGAAAGYSDRPVPEDRRPGEIRAQAREAHPQLGPGHGRGPLQRRAAGQGRPALRRRQHDADEAKGRFVLDPDPAERDRGSPARRPSRPAGGSFRRDAVAADLARVAGEDAYRGADLRGHRRDDQREGADRPDQRRSSSLPT